MHFPICSDCSELKSRPRRRDRDYGWGGGGVMKGGMMWEREGDREAGMEEEGGREVASVPGSLLKTGGRREPGNIREKSCRLPARHHPCDKRRTRLLLW